MTIEYKIEFHSPWHCGSGLSAGADVDALVIKDKDNLPYIPGKTLKGLIREAVEEYVQLSHACCEDVILAIFGPSEVNCPDDISKGEAFFTNAELSSDEQKAIVENQLQNQLYSVISSTAIDDDGIVLDHSLNRKQVVVPCSLFASIHFLEKNHAQLISKAIGMIKQIGLNRNRGLGRCTFCVINEKE